MGLINFFNIFFDMSQLIDQEFLDRKEWRKWLERNHSSEKEIWVIIQKKKSRKKGLKYQEALEFSDSGPMRSRII